VPRPPGVIGARGCLRVLRKAARPLKKGVDTALADR